MDEKRCPRCQESKPVDQFFANRGRRDNLSVYCKACYLAASAVSRVKHRLRIYDLLGGRRCNDCGITDVRVLTIDHLKGGGRIHRASVRGSEYSILRYVEEHPADYQVLCFNCNHLAKIARGEHGKVYTERMALVELPEKVTRFDRWARDYDACRDCGTTERKCVSYGRCDRCRTRHDRGSKPFVPAGTIWSKQFDRCQVCGTTKVKHAAQGQCRACYQRNRRRGS